MKNVFVEVFEKSFSSLEELFSVEFSVDLERVDPCGRISFFFFKLEYFFFLLAIERM